MISSQKQLLLGICFWREGLEAALGSERTGADRSGLRGGAGRSRWIGLTVVELSAGKVPDARPVLLGLGDFSTIFMGEEGRFPDRVTQFFLVAVFSGHQVSYLSAVVEDKSPAVVEWNLVRLPGGALVEALGLCASGVPFLVEPVEVRVVIRDPFLDGLPGWLAGLHGAFTGICQEAFVAAVRALDPGHFRWHVDEAAIDAKWLVVEGDEGAYGE